MRSPATGHSSLVPRYFKVGGDGRESHLIQDASAAPAKGFEDGCAVRRRTLPSARVPLWAVAIHNRSLLSIVIAPSWLSSCLSRTHETLNCPGFDGGCILWEGGAHVSIE